PRQDRYFNIIKQAKRYDAKGEYAKLWIPEIAGLPEEFIHTPDQLSLVEQEEIEFSLGTDYPVAMVETSKLE
ncbi:MAG: FAD-binding domain-containing protein, partial [Bacteroidota bacterium]